MSDDKIKIRKVFIECKVITEGSRRGYSIEMHLNDEIHKVSKIISKNMAVHINEEDLNLLAVYAGLVLFNRETSIYNPKVSYKVILKNKSSVALTLKRLVRNVELQQLYNGLPKYRFIIEYLNRDNYLIKFIS